jgi:crotonobetainyl-CoA hydratase
MSAIFLHEKMREHAMDLKFSKVERKGPITIITLSRPEVYNALHIDAHFELNKVFDDFSADPEQWVAVVTGAGDKAFCAGNDLKWQAAGGKRGWDKGGFAGLTRASTATSRSLPPVNGVAMGGGFRDRARLRPDHRVRERDLRPARAARRPRRARRRLAPAAATDRA